MNRIRPLLTFAAVALALMFVVADAHARAGGGFSGGSRGLRTFSPPAVTRTAPNPATPIQRSVTQPNAQPSVGGAPFGRPGFFGSGLFGGLAAGFLGAGLFGLLFGHGLFSGVGGFSGVLGLALQLMLVFFLARMAMRWWQSRTTPAFAGPAASMAHGFEPAAASYGGGGNSGEPLTIEKSDYDAFENLLGEIQSAYSAEDLTKLRAFATPEMVSYFAEDLSANASRGERNVIDNVKLVQGDLAEAWREGGTDYATVDMHFTLDDRVIDRASGRVLSGGPDEATEVWTFMRARGGAWLLSAIQQA